MLIRFFRSSFIIQYFVLILLTAVIWVPAFLSPCPVSFEPSLITPIYNLVQYLVSFADFISPAAALAILFISSLTLNNILIYHDLAPKNNILPAFLFILMFSSNPLTLSIYPLILTIPLFTWFLHTVFRINDEPENFIAVFNASILLSVISMIYPGAMFIFPIIWLFLLVFGTFDGRNLIISLMGFFLPYVYLATYYFWTDRLHEGLEAYREYFAGLLSYQVNIDYWQFAIWGVFFLLMLVPAFMKITNTLSSHNINFRKKMAATAWLLVLTLPMIFMGGPVDYHTLIYIPATVMISNYYNLFKKSVWNEIVVALFLILVLIRLYIQL